MQRYSSDPTDASATEHGVSEEREQRARRAEATALEGWIQQRVAGLGAAWSEEIKVRGGVRGGDFEGVMDRFTAELVRMLPLALGPRRQEVAPLWARACELYGRVGAARGLAAGEPIEEFHILRELVIQELFRDPPGRREPLSLHEILRLNRAFDRGVTHATVGHTDALFFELLERDDSVSSSVSRVEVAHEAESQLEALRAELAELMSGASTRAGEAARQN